jgi:uridine kinase
VAELLAMRPEPLLVAIDGCGAAGKSTFAARLAHLLGAATIISLDDFAEPGIATWDYERFEAEVLTPLKAGRPARYERRGWQCASDPCLVRVDPSGVVIAEGVSSTRHELGDPYDCTVWVATPRSVRHARWRARDGEALRPVWEKVWVPSEDAYVRSEHPELRVDFVVDGTAPA